LIDDILRGLDFCFAYLDDILVFLRSLKDHERNLRAIFGWLQTYGIRIILENCVFRASEVTFLGYRVSSEGSRPLEKKWPIFRTAPFLRPPVSS
jgi:hypothetical protein